jgi:hypothetical protein
MEPWWTRLLREQQETDFADLAGATASLTLPLSDWFVSRLIANHLPASSPVSDLEVCAEAGNQIVLRVRVARLSFIPRVRVKLLIERQPILPSSPVIVFRIVSEGLAALAGTALRFMKVLPPGVHLNGDRLQVNIAQLLDKYGLADVVAYLTYLELTTAERRIVLVARAAVPGPRGSGGAAQGDYAAGSDPPSSPYL